MRFAPPPQKPKRSLEQWLGGSIFFWIGAVMLALAGAFLVKYSIDVGLLTPAVRIVLGLMLGGTFLAGGQWLRKESPNAAQALAAAAVADWFASIFAATSLYHLISPAFGFVCLAIVTAIGIALALREGPFVGVVGLAGGFITPAIVSSGTPRPGVLFVYLFLIQLGSLVLQHKRGWWYLSALGIGGGMLWALGWVAWDHNARLAAIWLPLFLVATDLTQLWSLYGKGGVAVSEPMTLTARSASAACFLIMACWLIAGGYHFDDWGFFALMSIAHLAVARRYAQEEVPALVGAAIVVAAFATWSPFGYEWAAPLLIDRTDQLLAVGFVLGLAYGLGGFGFEFGARAPTRWAGLSTIGTAFLFGGAYLDLDRVDLWLNWPILAVILAALHGAAAYPLDRLRRAKPSYTGALGLHCLAASGFLALAVPMQFEHEWIAVSWAIELPVMAFVTVKLDLPWVRRGIWVGGALVIGAVLLSGFPVGEGLIFNRLLYGIGVPCVGMIATAVVLRRFRTDHREGRLLMLALQLAGAGLLALLVGLEIDHFIGRVAPDSGGNLLRAGTAAIVWAALAFGLYRLDRREAQPDRAIFYAALGFTVLACLATIAAALAFNPLFMSVDVGQTLFFNRLLLAYAAPAVLLFLVADQIRRRPEKDAGIVAQLLALFAFAVVFLWITTTIRQLTHGSILNVGPVTDLEFYGYSAGWTLELPLAAWLAVRLRLPALLYGIGVAALLVVGDIAISGFPTGDWLVFNPPLLGIGMPCIGMVATAWLLERGGGGKDTRTLTLALKLAAAALLAALIAVELYQVIGWIAPDSGADLLRIGTVCIAWLALSLGCFGLHRRAIVSDPAILYAAYLYGALASTALLAGAIFVFNPLFSPIEVGAWWVFNRLLLIYGVPAVLLLLLADRLRIQLGPTKQLPAQAMGLLALFTGFVWVSLTVRQIAHARS